MYQTVRNSLELTTLTYHAGTADTKSSTLSLNSSSFVTDMDPAEFLSTMNTCSPMPDQIQELRQKDPVSLPVEDTLNPVCPSSAVAENDVEYPVDVKWIGTGPNYTEMAADFQKCTDLGSILRYVKISLLFWYILKGNVFPS